MKCIITMAAVALAGWGALAAESTLDRSSKSNTNEVRNVDADNTGRNVRDREPMAVTPIDQGSSEADLSMTRRIRQAIVDSKDLSLNAKNVKVITNNGKVTLRGPVKTDEEKRIVSEIAEQVAQKANVDNQLEVVKEKAGEARKD